ncbi:hypothetical protein CB1_000334017 [Camelus ferus]|nr:hypothetical protein CB1_000334017 [Camelus ferus]
MLLNSSKKISRRLISYDQRSFVSGIRPVITHHKQVQQQRRLGAQQAPPGLGLILPPGLGLILEVHARPSQNCSDRRSPGLKILQGPQRLRGSPSPRVPPSPPTPQVPHKALLEWPLGNPLPDSSFGHKTQLWSFLLKPPPFQTGVSPEASLHHLQPSGAPALMPPPHQGLGHSQLGPPLLHPPPTQPCLACPAPTEGSTARSDAAEGEVPRLGPLAGPAA